MSVRILPHDPLWKARYATEAEAIGKALGPNIASIHHIGSTAIPMILAKPIIDILCVVRCFAILEDNEAKLMRLGYMAKGEYGIAGRRYYRKSDDHGLRTHHLHIFEPGSIHIDRHLAFRDYLRAFPEKADEYSRLKASIMGDASSGHHYQEDKAPFIMAVLDEAMEWHRRRP